MVEEAGVALLLGLVQVVVVVAAAVQLTRQRRRLRHVVLQGETSRWER